jgi:hypothetical protein
VEGFVEVVCDWLGSLLSREIVPLVVAVVSSSRPLFLFYLAQGHMSDVASGEVHRLPTYSSYAGVLLSHTLHSLGSTAFVKMPIKDADQALYSTQSKCCRLKKVL